MARWRDQRGVAMVTVLFVGAALTATASAAAFVTIQEFRAGTDDRRSADALAVAEAGIDRFLNELRTNRWTWGDIRQAGCVTTENPSGAPLMLSGDLGGGRTFTVNFFVFNPSAVNPADRFPPAACSGRDTSPRTPVFFAAESTGLRPAARRIIRQTIQIGVLNLPIGIYAKISRASGSPTMDSISLITDGDVTGRESFAFKGTDPYYVLKDFWPSLDGTTHIPAAVHATGHVYLKNQEAENAQEHRPGKPLNCTANPVPKGGTDGQSSWDQSGDGNLIPAPVPEPQSCLNWLGTPTGPPPTSKFTPTDLARVTPKPTLSDQDYITLRDAAKRSGLYCFFPKVGLPQCRKNGAAWTFTGTVNQGDVDAVIQADFIAYFEYEDTSASALLSNELDWAASVNGCNPDPGRSVVLIVRQGNLKIAGGWYINGAIIVPEGYIRASGGATINGTIIAKEFDNRGSATYKLNDCWVQNMPGPFLSVTAAKWSEIDR